ncbi:hypothetical protein ACIQ6V_33030 [Streptomyces sp. NPDC096198]|uniref:hypothetical protein n=1 Tax=Streptomyces sp. NPDC096198 TaxID=3366080 RepID=UPI0037FC029B
MPIADQMRLGGRKLKIMQRVASIGLAALAVVSVTTSASAAEQGDDASKQSLRAVEVTVTERTETETVIDGQVAKAEAAAPSSVTHFFTPQAPDYRGNSAYGHFTGQVRYHEGSHLSFAWSSKLFANVAATATGPMTESAAATRNGRSFGYSDSHPAVPANYLVHSSFRVDTSHYVLTVNEHFPIAGGKKYVTTEFDFTVTLI